MSLIRRDFLLASGSAVVGLVAGAWNGGSAQARAPVSRTQVPGFYRFNLGQFQLTVLSDGTIAFPSEALWPEATKAERDAVLVSDFQPTDKSTLQVNVLAVNTGDRLVLIDAGLSHVLSVNPKVKVYAPRESFGIFGSSLPSSFYRKDESIPAKMRYYNGRPPEVMTFGTAWQGANFELIDKTTEVVPGVTLIALVSDVPGTRELTELSLAINTPNGAILVVGCSHPGIEKIIKAAVAINPKIRLIAGGFHLVVAPDEVIAMTVAAIKDNFKVETIAPGHCTGEPTFTALKQAFGDRYIHAGVGTKLSFAAGTDADRRRGQRGLILLPIGGWPLVKIPSAFGLGIFEGRFHLFESGNWL